MVAFDDGVYKSYIYKGKCLIKEQSFIQEGSKRLLNGTEIDYFENGKIKGWLNYRLGEIDSVSLEYYENGSLSGKFYHSDGVPFGTWTYYFENGTPKTVVIYGPSSIRFRIDFDRNGKVTFMKGVPLLVYIEKRSISIQEELSIFNEVIDVDNYSSKLLIKIASLNSNQKAEHMVTDFHSIDGKKAFFYEANFNSPGRWVYETEVELIDEKSGAIVTKGVTSDTITVTK